MEGNALSCSQRVGKLIYFTETGCDLSASGKWLELSSSLWPASAARSQPLGCTFCRTEMPWTVWLERVSPARDAGSAVRLMHTPGFSWHVLSELLSSGTKICAGGASSADSHPRHHCQDTGPCSAHRRLLWSGDPWGSCRSWLPGCLHHHS